MILFFFVLKGGKLKMESHPLQILLSYLTYIRLSRSNERVRIMIELAKAEQEAAGQETEPEVRFLILIYLCLNSDVYYLVCLQTGIN